MIIPTRIIQSWKTKEVPPLIQKNIERIFELNPGYEYELSDDNDCREFLLKNFGQRYADAFDILRPGAFKCDLWRYAKLYKEGGIYLDLDMYPLVPFSEMIGEGDQLVSVVDRKNQLPCCIYQAFVACIAGHPVLKYTLDMCLENIEARKTARGLNLLDITGPAVMGRALNKYWKGVASLDNIDAGLYNSIRLYYNREDDVTVEVETGRRLILNKVDGYMQQVPGTYYTQEINLYIDKGGSRGKMVWLLIGVIVGVIVVIGMVRCVKK